MYFAALTGSIPDAQSDTSKWFINRPWTNRLFKIKSTVHFPNNENETHGALEPTNEHLRRPVVYHAALFIDD